MARNVIGDNKGVTIMEMIIVLAISAVLVVIVGLSLVVVNNANTYKSATSLKAIINKSKTQSMGKGKANGRLKINHSIGGTEVEIGSAGSELIAGRRIEAYYYVGNGIYNATEKKSLPVEDLTSFSDLNGTIYVEFNTAGMVSKVSIGSDDYTDLTLLYEFAFKTGNRIDAVVLYPATGKTETLMWYE